MDCHQQHQFKHRPTGIKKVLLMGNPNVGKSVIFNRLTGLDVVTANYTGTTVTYHEGLIRHQGSQALLIDVPGIYSLNVQSKAEEVAVSMLNAGADLIICVLDATHLERNLSLAFDLQNYDIPVVYSLNLSDVARRKGLEIDTKLLSQYLQAPVFETVAVKNLGVGALKHIIFQDFPKVNKMQVHNPIEKSQEIVQNVLQENDVELSLLERFSDWCIKPKTGIPIMFLVLALALGIIVGGGKAIRSIILLPFVNQIYAPLVTRIVERFVTDGIIYRVLVGEFGVLIKMIEWPFALILPYVLLFYIVFSFLEDSGYLPRLGVLMDGIFRKMGLPGSNIIPFILGYGCAVPAILGTRASGSKKERIIVVTLISIAVPCTAQTGAFITLLGDRSLFALLFVYMLSFITIFFTGLLLNRLLKGKSRPLILEIPNLLLPDFRSLSKKIWIKLKHFVKEAQVPMFFGILLAGLIVETGAIIWIGTALEPLVVGWLDLPKEASLSLLLGVIRRELAVMPLLEMDLTTIQLITGSVVALFYLPCISVFVILVKEFKAKIAFLIVLTTFFMAFFIGGLVQNILNWVM